MHANEEKLYSMESIIVLSSVQATLSNLLIKVIYDVKVIRKMLDISYIWKKPIEANAFNKVIALVGLCGIMYYLVLKTHVYDCGSEVKRRIGNIVLTFKQYANKRC